MKKFSIFIATIMMVTAMEAAEKLDLKSITSGEFSASYVTGINPIEGTDLYASISNDGKQIVSYSFKSGKQVAVLFDIHEAQAPFESIDGYVMSPDGKQLLVITRARLCTADLSRPSISSTISPAKNSASFLREKTSRWLPGRLIPSTSLS